MIFPLRERNVCEVWLGDELKKWSSHFLDNLSYCLVCAPQKYQASSAGFEPMTSAIALQRSWVRILLKTPDIFQVHKWDNHWDCPASVRITSSLTFILPLFYLFGVGWSVHCCNKFINSTEIQKKNIPLLLIENQPLLQLTAECLGHQSHSYKRSLYARKTLCNSDQLVTAAGSVWQQPQYCPCLVRIWWCKNPPLCKQQDFPWACDRTLTTQCSVIPSSWESETSSLSIIHKNLISILLY